MRTHPISALLVLVLAVPSLAQDTLVITTDDLRPALAEWTAHRTAQGHVIAVSAPGDDVRARVLAAHEKSEGRLRHVLLLGDVDRIPCVYRDTVAISPWEEDPRLATDAPYADVDGDDVPDLSIGRIPVTGVDDARAVLARSIAYETSPPPGTWRRRLSVFAGVGGFGAQEDMALEMLTRLILNNDVPASVETNFTYAKESSAFCPPPTRLQDHMLGTLAEGALVVAYVGHGSATHVDRMTWNDARHPILEAEAAGRVACPSGAPLVVFVACTTGKYDGAEPSLAETLLHRPAGPAAVIASSRVSTPYGNGILAVELLHALQDESVETVGELLLRTKRRLVDGADGRTRKVLDAMAGSFYETDPQKRDVDRREHALLYQVLGDPLLRLARPRSAKLLVPSKVAAGGTLDVLLESPVPGKALVELLPRRDAFAQPRKPGRTEDQFAADYARANVSPVVSVTATIESAGSPTRIVLEIPADLPPGKFQVRAFVEGSSGASAAGSTVRISKPR